MQAVSNGETIHSDTLKQKATELADELEISRKDFAASNGWLARFKHRKGIVHKRDRDLVALPATAAEISARLAIGLPTLLPGPGPGLLPGQAASFQAQLMEANAPPNSDLSAGVRIASPPSPPHACVQSFMFHMPLMGLLNLQLFVGFYLSVTGLA